MTAATTTPAPMQSPFPLPKATGPVLVLMHEAHLGNFVLALPMLRQLLSYFDPAPDILIEARYAPLLQLIAPAVTPLLYPSRSDSAGLTGRALRTLSMIRKLRCKHYAAVFDLLDSVRSVRLIRLCRYDRHIALSVNRHRDTKTQVLPPPIGPHCADRYAQALQAIGQTESPANVQLSAPAEVQAAVRNDLSRQFSKPDARFAVIHPASGKDYRRWPAERFTQVADHLSQAMDLCVVFIGTHSETAQLQAIRRQMKHPERSIIWNGPVDSLLALIEQSQILIANESGPTHLAATTHTPAIAIFGPSNEKEWLPRRSELFCVLRGQACDPACHPARCLHDYPCLKNLSARQVIQTAEELIQTRQSPVIP